MEEVNKTLNILLKRTENLDKPDKKINNLSAEFTKLSAGITTRIFKC